MFTSSTLFTSDLAVKPEADGKVLTVPASSASPEFREFLRGAADKHGSHEEFARQIGMQPAPFSRLISAKGQHSLDELKCLRLAKLTGEPPGRIFRMAGKGEMADLLEQLYGKQKPLVSQSERALLEAWDKLSPKRRNLLWTFLQELLPASKGGTGKTKSA